MRYRKILEENIFSLKELMKQGYLDIMLMPVKRFLNEIKWKSELEEEKQKLMQEEENKIKAANKWITMTLKSRGFRSDFEE